MKILRSPRSAGQLSLGLLVAAGVLSCFTVADSSTSSSVGPSSGAAASTCDPLYVSDGICDPYNNNEHCGYDGGDCCECTCTDGWNGDCGGGMFGYACIDPEAPCVDDDDVTEVIVSYDDIYMSYDDVTVSYDDDDTVTASGCTPGYYSDGFCDSDNNNELCGYDGGDCCECTCAPGGEYDCGFVGYDCIDPEAPCVDDDDVTEATFGDCFQGFNSDGECDQANNNELCGYDGGDCCECTCAPGGEYDCGESGYDCIDPEAPCVDPEQADPHSAAQSLTTSTATFIATFTAGLGVMHLINLVS